MRVRVLLVLLLLPASLPAATYHLEADGSGDFPTIAAALAVATAGDIVELGCGTYYEHDLVIHPGVTLRSEVGVASCATIDAQQQGRVLEGSPALLAGLTLRHGFVDAVPYIGAGAQLSGSVQILNCNFLSNRIAPGYPEAQAGALYAHGAKIDLVHCRFSGNDGGEWETIGLHGEATLVGCSLNWEGLTVEGAADQPCVISGCEIIGRRIGIIDAELRMSGTLALFASIELLWGSSRLDLSSSSLIRGRIVNWDYPNAFFLQRCVLDNTELFPVGSQPEMAYVACSDLHGVDAPPLILDQVGQEGNFSADPLFCNAPGGDYRLHANSPCAPAGNECGVLIGALPVGCEATATEMRSWGSIKALY